MLSLKKKKPNKKILAVFAAGKFPRRSCGSGSTDKGQRDAVSSAYLCPSQSLIGVLTLEPLQLHRSNVKPFGDLLLGVWCYVGFAGLQNAEWSSAVLPLLTRGFYGGVLVKFRRIPSSLSSLPLPEHNCVTICMLGMDGYGCQRSREFQRAKDCVCISEDDFCTTIIHRKSLG